MKKKTDKIEVKMEIDLVRGHLIKDFHRQIMEGELEQTEEALGIIFDMHPADVMPHHIIAVREFIKLHAAEWGSPDLATPTEGVTIRQFGIHEGGRAQ